MLNYQREPQNMSERQGWNIEHPSSRLAPQNWGYIYQSMNIINIKGFVIVVSQNISYHFAEFRWLPSGKCLRSHRKSPNLYQGLVNVLTEHHPNIGNVNSNKYLTVMFKIPKMGHLPNTVWNPNDEVEERRMSLTSEGSPSCSKPDTKCVVLELSVKLKDNGLGKTWFARDLSKLQISP